MPIAQIRRISVIDKSGIMANTFLNRFQYPTRAEGWQKKTEHKAHENNNNESHGAVYSATDFEIQPISRKKQDGEQKTVGPPGDSK